MEGTAAPVIAGLAAGISFIVILSIASLNDPLPPDMMLVVEGRQYKAGIGPYDVNRMDGTGYVVDIDSSETLPNATIDAKRGSEIQFLSSSLKEPALPDSLIINESSNIEFFLDRINHTSFRIPIDVTKGDYVLTVRAEWNDNDLISAATYNHKISISEMRIPSPDEISDSELINRTSELEEVKAILSIYDQPLISVDRIEDFGVEYNISTTQLEGKAYDKSKVCLYVKILMDSDGYPESLLDGVGPRLELGDESYIEFLEGGGVCVFTLINRIPDSLAISRTKELEEVQAFLAKYPSAEVWASRLVIIEVGYGITKSDVTGEPWNYPDVPESSATLRLQVDKDLDVTSIVLECIIQKGTSGSADAYDITEDIVGYLQKEGDCWNDRSLRQPFAYPS